MAHDNNPVKIPANHISLIKRIEKFLNIFLQTNNRPPTDQEIVD
jgi:DNA-directed RNA polymerase specialized sigma subunit